ncbi:sugar phosphate isomerase/epimerase family protein [Companilactobacillus huachuanensis]|uniref:Sugar phosphate isomerase/epimerase family protein n=1 Tax=Companilactobacillus huachuanensis TaxID=2559914 RepID=A0ABW1RP45_9LACO|nr:sugar phosphate isomerase/epimerase [Companilactobacillus huachuanensis]
MKYAAELWPVLSDYEKDPDYTLSKLKNIGYDGIEMFGISKFTPSELKALIAKSKLVLSGYQLPWTQFQGNQLKQTILYQKELGNKHIIIDALGGPWESGHKISENTISMWQAHAARINQINDELKENNMDLTYHTHDYDYGELIEGTVPSLEILLKNISPSVNIEIDTGNCIEGGKSPSKYIKSLKGRVPFVHCKPYAKSLQYEVRLGSDKDENNWSEIFNSAQNSGTKWLVVEPESLTLGNIFDVLDDSLKQLKTFTKD